MQYLRSFINLILMQITDQLGRTLIFTQSPITVVSTVPSITEFLCDLGLEEKIIGITKFCIYPESVFRSKERIGGTKTLKVDRILELAPDLIIANKEENTKDQIEELAEHLNIYVSDVFDIQTNEEMMDAIAKIFDKAKEVKVLKEQINNNQNLLLNYKFPLLKAMYIIWQNPIMSVGGDTFIHYMMETAGFQNVLHKNKRYPSLKAEQLRAYKPDILLLSSEPFPFSEKHIQFFRDLLPNTKIELVDGSFFSWYGSRVARAFEYFISLRKSIKD